MVTLEDGGRQGGVGAAVTDALAPSGIAVRVLALPQQFLEPAARSDLLADLGLTAQAVARGVTELIASRHEMSALAGDVPGRQSIETAGE